MTSSPPDSAPTPDSSDATPPPLVSKDEITLAIEALTAGGVIALPTETVYGLAVRADNDEALARLRGLQAPESSDDSSPPASPLSGPPIAWHTANYGTVAATAALPAITGRLVDRYWPGPLTLVLQGPLDNGAFGGAEALAVDGWTGVRVPAEESTTAILGAVDFPVAMIQARRADGEGSITAAEVRAAFPAGTVDLVIDGGRSSLGSPSSVLAVGPRRFEVLREGILGEEDLRRAAGLSILFVCTGNTCRSPMAEGLARAAIRRALAGTQDSSTSAAGEIDETLFGFHIASAGVYAGVGSPPSENAVTALADRGIDLSGHGSRPAVDREVAGADRVYCLTRSHRAALLEMLPPSAADSVELLDPAGRDVPDPFGGPLEVYRQTADVIEGFIEARLKRWV